MCDAILERKNLIIIGSLVLATVLSTVAGLLMREHYWRTEATKLTQTTRDLEGRLEQAETRSHELAGKLETATKTTKKSTARVIDGLLAYDTEEVVDARFSEEHQVRDLYERRLSEAVEEVTRLQEEVKELTLKVTTSKFKMWNVAYLATASPAAPLAPRHWAGAGMNFLIGPVDLSASFLVGAPPAGYSVSGESLGLGLLAVGRL